jgi:hypothetical protein
VAVLTASGMAQHHEISRRLFAQAPNVRKYSTILVLDALRTGSAIPARALKL